MGHATGTAALPLHGGRVPEWLASRMAALGRVVVEALVHHCGRAEVLRRLAHPHWFQSLGAVMGMDWHSSGITTSVLGALKRGLEPVADELGLYVCGGRGRHSRKTPDELKALGERTGLDSTTLIRASKLTAKVDSAAVQDGFELYLHGFVASSDGQWCVVQQGMHEESGWARRYHWLSDGLTSFVDAPHQAIDGRGVGEIVNLTDTRAAASREAQVALVATGPDEVSQRIREVLPTLQLPAHHDVTVTDVFMRRVHAAMVAAQEAGPRDFCDVLLTPGVGARTVFALAQVAEVMHGAPCRFVDPARFSLAHGGKDGHPFPVPLKVMDETVRVLKDAVGKAKLGNTEKLEAIKRLDDQTRALEGVATGPAFDELVEHERSVSWKYGGMTVDGPARPTRKMKPAQLSLALRTSKSAAQECE